MPAAFPLLAPDTTWKEHLIVNGVESFAVSALFVKTAWVGEKDFFEEDGSNNINIKGHGKLNSTAQAFSCSQPFSFFILFMSFPP